MTQVPLGAGAVLAGSPIRGTADEIAEFEQRMTRVLDRGSGFRRDLELAVAQLATSEGRSVSAIAHTIEGRLLPGAALLDESASGARDAFAAYGAEVRRIHAAALRVSGETNDALGAIRAQAHEIEHICRALAVPQPDDWEAVPPATLPPTTPDALLGGIASTLSEGQRAAAERTIRAAHEQQWMRAATRWHQELGRISALRQGWTQLIAEREAAEAAVASRLRGTRLGRLLSASDAATQQLTIAAGVCGELWGQRAVAPAAQALDRLLSGTLSPGEVTRLWRQLERSGTDVDALISTYSVEFAALDGIPSGVMDLAGRRTLDYALDPHAPEHLRLTRERMRLSDRDHPLDRFESDLRAIVASLRQADELTASDDRVQLVALGQHDGAVTAGIAFGDLDAAPTVGVLVSGMHSDVRGLPDAFDAFREIRAGANDIALVTWAGYRSPTIVEEPWQSRADAGAPVLASFLDGVALRQSERPLRRLVVIGHSYGTNVAAEALQLTTAPVDALVTLGSAGLQVGTRREELGVAEVHATHARGDDIARGLGQHAHFRWSVRDGGNPLYAARVDPRHLDGARAFSSELTADGVAVTMHNLTAPIAWPLGLQWFADRLDGRTATDEIGYLHPGSSTVSELGKIMRSEWQ